MGSRSEKPLRQPGIFGQMTWDTYTVVVLGFRTSKAQHEVADALDNAAMTLTSAFPFLAGQVIREGRTETNSGTYSIVPYPPHDGKSPVRRKDCTKLCPTFDQLAEAKAPFSMLDGNILCPTKGMGYVYDHSEPLPVLVIQANFISGGLLLCFSSNHNAVDMNGQGQLIKFFATACRGDAFDPKDIQLGNMDEHHFLLPLQNGEKYLDHEAIRKPSSLSGPPPPQIPAPWKYWRFRASKLAKLKVLASTKSYSDAEPWISTNDALTAFYVQRLTAVRLASGRIKPDATIRCQRAANGRSKLNPPVPAAYMGHMVVLAYTDWSASTLATSPLSAIAADLRRSLNEIDDYHMRSLTTLLNKTDDKSTIFYDAKHIPGQNIMVTSWAGLGLASVDFGGILGKPAFIRRANMAELCDLVYIMPKTEEGDIDVGMSLMEVDAEGLMGDEEWRQMTEYIG